LSLEDKAVDIVAVHNVGACDVPIFSSSFHNVIKKSALADNLHHNIPAVAHISAVFAHHFTSPHAIWNTQGIAQTDHHTISLAIIFWIALLSIICCISLFLA